MARNLRPDFASQPYHIKSPLHAAHTGRRMSHWVNRATLTPCQPLPVHLQLRTSGIEGKETTAALETAPYRRSAMMQKPWLLSNQ